MYGYKFIALEYILRGSFSIDILSSFQLDVIYGSLWGAAANTEYLPYLKIIGMVKIQRLRRISKIIGSYNASQENKAQLKVL